jgi:predicted nuclease of predicted toxin-antitoxin system
MMVLVDENIPKVTVQALMKLGYDVLDIRGTDKQGTDDESLWMLARSETRLLITTDKGFVTHRDEDHHGILPNGRFLRPMTPQK